MKRLVDSVLSSGMHNEYWNGQNKNGKAMPSGVYFARLRTDHHLEVRKLMLTR